MGVQRFEELLAWQKARQLVKAIYRVASQEPISRDFGFRNQICRAAISAMSNIAEGFARRSHADFAHFLDIARGSVAEVQSLLYVAFDVQYIDEPGCLALQESAAETARLVAGLIAHLRNK
jgi:four helix bundle protein